MEIAVTYTKVAKNNIYKIGQYNIAENPLPFNKNTSHSFSQRTNTQWHREVRNKSGSIPYIIIHIRIYVNIEPPTRNNDM